MPTRHFPELRRVHFAFDSSTLDRGARDAIAQDYQILRGVRWDGLTIEGHCDERGTTEYNFALGQRRAEVVRQYLRSLGAPDAQMTTMSYGYERPLVQGSSEIAWSQNRRAELVPH